MVSLRDDGKDESELEDIEEMLENLVLTLGGTTIGAYFAKVLHLRHYLKELFLGIFAMLAGAFTKLRSKKK
jgi:hypothetical protein